MKKKEEEKEKVPDQFPISMAREALLERHARVFKDALVGLRCDAKIPFWKPARTAADEARCVEYKRAASYLSCLSYTYYVKCYDGPGYDCQREIPKLEEKHGAWLDGLAAMYAILDKKEDA
jgi:hypothetical protein